MHPYHRGPPRLFWFVIGAASATVFFRSQDFRYARADGRVCWRDHVASRAYPAPDPQSQPAPGAPSTSDALPERHTWVWRSPRDRSAQPSPPPASSEGWEEERQRVFAMGKQATDTIADISEGTLESLLETVQGLKAKFAESRAQREQELQELQKLRTEELRQFEEWRRQQQQQQPRHIV